MNILMYIAANWDPWGRSKAYQGYQELMQQHEEEEEEEEEVVHLDEDELKKHYKKLLQRSQRKFRALKYEQKHNKKQVTVQTPEMKKKSTLRDSSAEAGYFEQKQYDSNGTK